MKKTLLILVCALIGTPAFAQIAANGYPPGVTPPIFGNPSAIDGSGRVTSAQILAPDGTASAPSYSFTSATNQGMFSASTSQLGLAASASVNFVANSTTIAQVNTTSVRLRDTTVLDWGSSGLSTPDVSLSRGAAGRPEWSSSTGIRIGSTQTTDPTCTSNCGTSPSVVGTDSEFTVTMGSSGSPASGFVITFNGTWGSNPQCVGAMAKAGMAVGKLPLTLVTTTTTLTVVTNGTAPATTDIYNFICRGGR